MEDSPLGSSPDVEQCVLESSSNQSLSVGYFPHEERSNNGPTTAPFMKDPEACMQNQKDDQDHASVLTDSPQEEDLQPCSSASPHMDQVSYQESEACEDLPKCDPPEDGDMDQFPEMPPELEDDEIVEMESQEICTAETSSEPSKEEDVPSEEENTCCLNLRLAFKWLRKRVVSALTGRNRPGRANNSSILLAIKRRHLFGGNKVQPQESL
ncbi:Hypothetical predicted protein [Marmota monax]|uniref:Uncharacterized protein n=1 Tax=Marmota monax TaxID=9995 RepID=A0A5E4CGP4_MARMO|nr:hypothetical protein GHT09_015640 [Marmota monax]VTJ81077.1 Hypothetical predicted protein [Marmota monax]